MSIFLAGNRSLDIIPFFVFSSKQKQKLHENLYFLSELKREPIGLHIKKQPRRWWQNQKVTVLLYYRILGKKKSLAAIVSLKNPADNDAVQFVIQQSLQIGCRCHINTSTLSPSLVQIIYVVLLFYTFVYFFTF